MNTIVLDENLMINWQAFYTLNKHRPLNEVMAEYNRILLEFNERLQLLNEAKDNIITQQSPPPGAGAGGSSETIIDLIDWEPKTINILSMIGLYDFQNQYPLSGVTNLSILAKTNNEGFIIEDAQDLNILIFTNLETIFDNGFVAIESNPNLASVSFPKLTNCSGSGFYIDSCDNLKSVDLSKLINLERNDGGISITDCQNLTNIDLSSLMTFPNGFYFYFYNNALSQECFDNLMIQFSNAADVNNIENCYVYTNGGTSAYEMNPSAGYDAFLNLVNNYGWNIFTND